MRFRAKIATEGEPFGTTNRTLIMPGALKMDLAHEVPVHWGNSEGPVVGQARHLERGRKGEVTMELDVIDSLVADEETFKECVRGSCFVCPAEYHSDIYRNLNAIVSSGQVREVYLRDKDQ